MTQPTRPASAVWLRRWRAQYAADGYGSFIPIRLAVTNNWHPCTQTDLANKLFQNGYRCSARTVRRWERIGPPAWVRRVLDGEGR